MGCVIQIQGLVTGRPSQFDGQYVSDYEPHPGGAPLLDTVKDPAKAKVFADHAEAMEYWRQSRGTRPDGKPDRPLTAFTVLISLVDEQGRLVR